MEPENIFSMSVFDVVSEETECKYCGSPLDEHLFCADEKCPYWSLPQNVELDDINDDMYKGCE